jgi:predicted GNAT family acetyltransferase
VNTAGDKRLDNPVWYALSEAHQDLAIDHGNIKFYHPDYCPFGGYTDGEAIAHAIDQYSEIVDHFFIVGENPALSDQLRIEKELVCLQMVMKDEITVTPNDQIIKLTAEHGDALYQLVNLVQPGYFKMKTALLGDYFGIFKNDELIAAAGERMQMNGLVEVSAVVTHPGHTGQGYAKQLVACVVHNILRKNSTPFLHVAESNVAAIRLYEKLGFTTRRKISFWSIVKY